MQSLNNRSVVGLEEDSNNMFREVSSVIHVSFVRFRLLVVELHQVQNTLHQNYIVAITRNLHRLP